MGPAEANKLLERYAAAKTVKAKSDNLRYLAGKYAWPRAMYQTRTPESHEGEETPVDKYDDTAVMAAYRMTTGMFSSLMPVGARWFQFAVDYDDPELQKWLSTATSKVHEELWRSNFVREMFISVRSMNVFGTGIISVQLVG